MPIGRPHSFALIGALLALTPAVALGGSVDVQVTSAIPVPALQDKVLPDTATPPPLNVALLKTGLDALAANDIPGARAIRDGLPANSPEHHILA